MTKRFNLLLASSAFIAPRAFDTGSPGWQMEGDTIAIENGNPVYLDAAGNKMVVEVGTISRLNGEAKTHRERAEKAEKALKPFEGLDAAAARDAFDKLSKIDQKKLIDSGEVDRVREEVGKSYAEKMGGIEKERDGYKSNYENLLKNSTLNGSRYIDDNIAIPKDIFIKQFGDNFRVEDGKVVPYDSNGNKIYSTKRASEIATVDEALEAIVNNYANKDAILKAPTQRGQGNGGGGGNRGGGRTMTRAAFDALGPMDRGVVAGQMQKGEIKIVD